MYDDHPQAFNDEDPLVAELKTGQDRYLILPETLILNDPQIYLVSCIFGGLKQIRNDKRCVTTISIIATKVLEYELNEGLKDKPSTGLPI